MKWIFRLLLWHFALGGAGAVVKLNLGFGAPGMAVVVTFLLAGVLSTLQPKLSALWATLAGGAAAVSEVIPAVADPAFTTAAPGWLAFLIVLPLAIGIAGAAAGSAVPARIDF